MKIAFATKKGRDAINDVSTLILVLSFLSSCQTTQETRPPGPPPDWVVRTPNIEGMICAVGASEPTYFREDAKKYAAEGARKELARTINISIRTIMVDTATVKGSRVDEATVSEVSSWATSAVVENSKIIEYWFDAEGQAGKRDITYALGCMPRKFDKNSLEKKLTRPDQAGRGNPEDISRTAEEIIKFLEEEKQREKM
ncbi:MAG: LPP20 family lipoprotein [Nitrospirae bacterium]|nr:LPP20 family lipoprotein [Nitrospirota bacterium]